MRMRMPVQMGMHMPGFWRFWCTGIWPAPSRILVTAWFVALWMASLNWTTVIMMAFSAGTGPGDGTGPFGDALFAFSGFLFAGV